MIRVLVVLRATLLFKRRRFPAAGGTGLLQHAAQVTHLALYALLLVLPLLGWANASSRGWTVSLFGLLPLPPLLPTGAATGPVLGDLHGLAATLLLVGVGLHVAAVLYHQVLLKDRLLQRMFPESAGMRR